MIDLTSKEEAMKHLQHITSTFINLDEPLKIIKDKYELKVFYLGNVIYKINTKPLDMTIEELFQGVDK